MPTQECPHPEQWRCYDDLATEIEVLDFLYALVRMLKPELTVVETGTYLGHGTIRLAQAVRDNGCVSAAYTSTAKVFSAEPSLELRNKAKAYIAEQQLSDYAIIWQGTGEEMITKLWPSEGSYIDFAFLDSDGPKRINEMRALLPKLSPGGVVAVHDTNTYHDQHSGIRSQFLEFAFMQGMQVINLDTPRGLMLLRKGLKYGKRNNRS